MKIIAAFDSFKGSITASEACDAAGEALAERFPDAEVVRLPMSDGGEGLVSCARRFLDLEPVTIRAHGPLMEELEAVYAVSRDGRTAYMEMAATSGLTLIPTEKRNPLLTTTFGVGEMIVDASRRGVRHIVMGIGGSATNDGGKGMIDAIEASGICMEDLPSVIAACDVDNPLCGERGASAVFGPQKGADGRMVEILDARLREFAAGLIEGGKATRAMMDCPGAGAAGGLGFGLMACLGAELKPGIEILLDLARFNEHLDGASLVITGEGRSDRQTLMGKVPCGILRRAMGHGVPVCLLSGSIDDADGMLASSFSMVRSINDADPAPLEYLMRPEVAMKNLARTIREMDFAQC